MLRFTRCTSLLVAGLFALVHACPAQSQEPSASGPAKDAESELIPDTAVAILGLAADAAVQIPLDPHVKTRSRLQAEIVATAVATGHYDVARAIVPEISNWRRGLAQATIASGLAEAGESERARAELAVAEGIEVTLTGEMVQGWRRDRVRAQIALTYAHLGDVAQAAAIQARLEGAEAGRLATISARMADLEKIDQNTAAFVAVAQTGELEQIQSALLGIVEFYGMLEAGDERLTTLERAIRDNWTRIPGEPRIQILESLVAKDLAAGRMEHATSLVDEIEAMVRDKSWSAEQGIALLARVGRHRHALGQKEQSLKVLREAVGQYEAAREGIVSIWRGRSLRPLAEAFHAVGSPTSAVQLYERALIEAVENPNSRPRLEDLVLTCNSIVATGVQTPESLRKALMRTRAALGIPW